MWNSRFGARLQLWVPSSKAAKWRVVAGTFNPSNRAIKNVAASVENNDP
jgi:hypothetical protein